MSKNIYCPVCKHQKNCKLKNPDKCQNFEMKQDDSTWYLEGNKGIRHPLDMD